MSNPYSYHISDPLGELYKFPTIPDINSRIKKDFIKLPEHYEINPLPGQYREGGKIIDTFDPDFPPIHIFHEPPQVPRPSPQPERYEIFGNEAFAQTFPRPGSLSSFAHGLH